MKIRIVLAFIVMLTLSCKTNKNMDSTTTNTPVQEMGLDLVLSDNYGGTELPEVQVIRDPETLKQFFYKINKTRKPGLPVPEIDFGSKTVVIYCTGRMQGTEIPTLAIMQETEDEIRLGVNYPDAQTVEATAVVMPFGLYTLPVTDKKISIEAQR